MNPKKKKQDKSLFIQIISAAAIILAVFMLYLSFHKFIISKKNVEIEKAYYLAEVGLNRAIWYLNTPKIQGGLGIKWRTEGRLEHFDPGTYYIIVEDGDITGEVIVTSIGSFSSYSKAIKQALVQDQLPSAFDYAVFSNSSIKIEGNAEIIGDVYGRGNININYPSKVEDGYVYACRGHIVAGSGDYRVGGTSTTSYIPFAEHSFYDGKISYARNSENRLNGDQKYKDLNLSDDIFVNGSININGKISGNGCLVATKDIKINKAVINGRPKLISGGNIEIENSSSSDKHLVLYSNKDIRIKGKSKLKGSFISRYGKFVSDGDVIIYGLIYCSGKGSEIKNKTKVYGSLVTTRIDTLKDNIAIRYESSCLPNLPPPGLAAKILNKKSNSRQEL